MTLVVIGLSTLIGWAAGAVKAGLIVGIFMHMAWERISLVYAILVPPLCLATLVILMAIESDYTFWTRILFFDRGG